MWLEFYNIALREGTKAGGRATLLDRPVSVASRMPGTVSAGDTVWFSEFRLCRGSQICVVDTPRWIQWHVPLLFVFDYGI